jgi:hypothetical protein
VALIYLSAITGTKKCVDAESKGVVVVDEEWVRQKMKGGGESSKSTVKAEKSAPIKKAIKAKLAPQHKPKASAPISGSGALSGFTFAITGD